MTAPLLEVSGLTVSFDGARALDELDLGVGRGELRFLIGPNGAGKTTLLDCLTGLTKPDRGAARFDGQDLLGRSEHAIVRLGIGRSFQTPTVFDALTVAENVDLAATFRRPLYRLLGRRREVDAAIGEALATVGLAGLAAAPATTLSHGQKQWLELAMLLVQQPRVLLLDEPVAGMTKAERARTGALLQQLAATRTVVVVEHDMDFVRRFAPRVTVLHEGRVVADGSVAAVQADPLVRQVYLGGPRQAVR